MNLLESKKGDPINTFIVPFLHHDMIEDCVDSIWEHCSPEKHRLIVVDNSCEEGMYEKLHDKCHLYIKSYRNLGCTKSWNIGPALSHTKYLTIIGDDTQIIHEKWWEEVEAEMEANDYDIVFCHPCHLTEEYKKEGKYTAPEFTDEMWEEAKQKSGDMVGRYNAIVMKRTFVNTIGYEDEFGPFLFNEDLYPCYVVDRDTHDQMEKLNIPKIGLHLPVWHIRGVTCQRGIDKVHDDGPSSSRVEDCPKVRRHL